MKCVWYVFTLYQSNVIVISHNKGNDNNRTLLFSPPESVVLYVCIYEAPWESDHNAMELFHLNPYADGGELGLYKMMQKKRKITETLTHGYSSESSHCKQSNEYQHDRIQMVVFKSLVILVLSMKVASALEGLNLTFIIVFSFRIAFVEMKNFNGFFWFSIVWPVLICTYLYMFDIWYPTSLQ